MDFSKAQKLEISVLKSVLNDLKRSFEEEENKNSVLRKELFQMEERKKIMEGKMEKLIQMKKDLEDRRINLISELNSHINSLEYSSKQIEEIRSQKQLVIDSHSYLCGLMKIVNIGETRVGECDQVFRSVQETELLMENKLLQAKKAYKNQLSEYKNAVRNGTEMLERNWLETCRHVEELVTACDQLCEVTNYKQ